MVSKKNQNETNFRNKKCDYYDRGYCKHGENCNYEHPDNVCLIANCFEDKCSNRHTNPCKYGPRCHYNRHNKCFYSNVTMVNGGDDKQMKEKLSKIKEMENKVEEMQKKMKHIENKINKTSPDNSDLAKEVDKKIDTFEDQLKQFRKVLEEKDLNILNLNKKVEILEKKCKCEDILKKNQELEKTVALNKKKIGVF